MSSRSQTISKLLEDQSSRAAYVRAKLNHLIPSQIKALRLDREWTQKQLGEKSEMKQARISAMEKPGEVAFSVETLIRLAASFSVALQVRFVPFSEMLRWDNDYSQDEFCAEPLEKDNAFLNPITQGGLYPMQTAAPLVQPNMSSYTPSAPLVQPNMGPYTPLTLVANLAATESISSIENERELVA